MFIECPPHYALDLVAASIRGRDYRALATPKYAMDMGKRARHSFLAELVLVGGKFRRLTGIFMPANQISYAHIVVILVC